MSHFYGSVKGNRGYATRGGTKNSGYQTIAASWDGAIEVKLIYNPKTDENIYIVYQSKWNGKGVDREIARGIIGDGDFSNPVHKHEEAYDAGYRDGLDDGYKEAMGSR